MAASSKKVIEITNIVHWVGFVLLIGVVPSKVKIESLVLTTRLIVCKCIIIKEVRFFLLFSTWVLLLILNLSLRIRDICVKFAKSMIESCWIIVCVVFYILLLPLWCWFLLWYSLLLLLLPLSKFIHLILGSWSLLSDHVVPTSSLSGCFVVFSIILSFVWVVCFFIFVVEMPLGPLIVPQVWKWLIVDSELILVTVLHDIQEVLANSKGELECIFEFWVKKNLLTVLQNLLFAWQHTSEELDGVVLIVQFESPDVLFLGALEGLTDFTNFEELRLDRHENILINYYRFNE